MDKLINTYMQGKSVIEQFVVGVFVADGVIYEQVETYRDGVWCDTQTVEA